MFEPWRRILSPLGIELRRGEAWACTLLFSFHFLLFTVHYAAKTVRQSTFIDALGVENLPLVYLAVALVAYPVVHLYERVAHRPPASLLVMTCLVTGISMVAFYWLFGLGFDWVSPLFYVWVGIVTLLQVSQFWLLVGLTFDSRQARRLYGLVGAGGLLGGIAGGQVARAAAALGGTRIALLAAAALLFLMAGLAALGSRWQGPTPGEPEDELKVALSGAQTVRRSPYLRRLTLLVLVAAMVAQVVDLQFAWAVESTVPDLDGRTAIFGNVYSIMGISAFLFQLVATTHIHRRLGVATALRILPSTMALGTVGVMATGALAPLLLPMASGLKILENGLRYSLDQSTRELLFLPIPPSIRRQAKTFIDVFGQRLAKGTAAVLLLSVTFGWWTPIQAGAITLVLVAIWLGVAASASRHYLEAFRERLEAEDSSDQNLVDTTDAATLELLIESVGSPNPRLASNSIDLLRLHGKARLVPPVLLLHDDPGVRAKALEALVEGRRDDAVPLVERLLADPEASLRAAAIRALAHLSSRDADDLMALRIDDPNLPVRAAAIGFLSRSDRPELRRAASSALEALIDSNDGATRVEAANALAEIDDPHFSNPLVALLYDRELDVTQRAVVAVERRQRRTGFNPLYLPILIAHLRHRRLKHLARPAIVSGGEEALEALAHFMNDPNEDLWVRRAIPKTMAALATPSAARALVGGLASSDLFLRRKVIEALGEVSDEARWALSSQELDELVISEAEEYLQTLAHLVGLEVGPRARVEGVMVSFPSDPPPCLLQRLCADRLRAHLGNLFALLALGHPSTAVPGAHRALLGDRPEARAHAIEFLDNTLSAGARDAVLTVVGDLPVLRRLEQARLRLGTELETGNQVLGRLLARPTPGDDDDDAWLVAAALHAVAVGRIEALYPVASDLATGSSSSLVRESASWLLATVGDDPALDSGSSQEIAR